MSDKLVLLYSGGLDSTVLLKMALQFGLEPHCLLINYGQKHVRELDAAVEMCGRLHVPYYEARVELPHGGGRIINSALTGQNVSGLYEGVSEFHVPGRNTIFVGLAISLAESIRAKKVWFGPNFADCLAKFPDCLQSYVAAINEVTKQAGSFPIEVETPLLGMRKETIKALAKTLGISDEEVHSGYAV